MRCANAPFVVPLNLFDITQSTYIKQTMHVWS